MTDKLKVKDCIQNYTNNLNYNDQALKTRKNASRSKSMSVKVEGQHRA